ncbi:MAG: type I polyketide synthase [Chloroflexi bacterium]|nr:type I polyketide synthase [Chloroflexota bacterium]MCI0581195.1 type I polyketide synthase [Chloroflexota bacterium]MCI0644119.1 type I polyketide synthase [Chloroflexota bacterium]MCI0731740.1 type I polyketide synthase [Chloroflexota bacterium]
MNDVAHYIDELTPLQRAVFALREAKARLAAAEQARSESVAIIGMACRFPGGAHDPDSFWHLLRNRGDGICEVPADRWNVEAYYNPDLEPGTMNTRWGGFLEQIDQFDARFFDISAREASCMDPQQRLLLEVAWESLENSGLAADQLAGSQTGVFMGVSTWDYSRLHADAPTRGGTGIALSVVANRLSYAFDLRGPSMIVDTACSSSLLSAHLACQSLRNGECDLALAGGVNIILTPDTTIGFAQVGMMAPDGRCKTFDAAANGYVRGEGCGVLVLKRLSDAQRDGDNVLALILGSATNQDGRSNGLTAPNGQAQVACIRRALQTAGIRPSQINYVEAHGTGTPLGDAVEVQSLISVLSEGRTPDQACVLSAVKSNIGHLEAAAGVAGLIKVVLSLQHRAIPPVVHFRELNPNITLDGTPFVIAKTLHSWPESSDGAYAGVSGFSFSGSNVHVVLGAPPEPQPKVAGVERPLHILTLSAKSVSALQALTRRYVGHLADPAAGMVADVCYTVNAGRSHFNERLAIVGADIGDLRGQLAAAGAAEEANAPHIRRGHVDETERARVAFLFTGQGAQYPRMGQELYRTQPVFRDALDQCDELLRPHLARPLLSLLYPVDDNDQAIDETAYCQPALFAFEYALAALWGSWGIVPDVVMGHSVGEYVAACVAGVFSLEDGLKLIAARGRLMQSLPQNGVMAFVAAGSEEIAEALAVRRQQVAIAAVNGPNNTVISGELAAVQAVLDRLEDAFIHSQPLNTSHAFHSPLMDPILVAFGDEAQAISYHPPQTALVSGVTGGVWAPGQIPDAAYWQRHLREPVLFQAAVETLWAKGYRLFLEIGPHHVLTDMGVRCVPGRAGVWLPSLLRDSTDWPTLLGSLAELYVQGLPVNWAGFDRGYARRKVQLPNYPYERRRHWLEPDEIRPDGRGDKAFESRY